MNNVESKTVAMSYNEAIGIAVNQYLFLQKKSKQELSHAMGVSRVSVSKKVHGQVTWSAEELGLAAEFLGVGIEDLAPKRTPWGTWVPAQINWGYEKTPVPENQGLSLVAGTGFEPATSGL